VGDRRRVAASCRLRALPPLDCRSAALVSSLAAIGIGFLAAAQWALLAYFAALSLLYLALNVLAFRAVRGTAIGDGPAMTRHPYSGLEPPVSLLLPAFDVELSIAASVRSLLQLVYSEFELIVISDGSHDGTLAAMTDAFDLQPTPYSLSGAIPTALVRSVYTSRQFPNLRLIDKENGGHADALNAGINAARYPLFCAVAVDSIFERDSLRRLVRPFQEDPHMIAAGGTVRPFNGCRVTDGFLESVALPHKVLPLIQIVETLHAFVFSRMGWSSLNAVLILAGAFGVFRRASVIDAGGYRHSSHGTIGADMELVMRLHRLHRSAHLAGYQSARLAKRYRTLVDKVRRQSAAEFGDVLARAVAVNYAKLLAYKDEYEVARLFTDGRFEKQLKDRFDGDYTFSFHLAPPLLPSENDHLGRPKKKTFGPWMMKAFRVLAALRFVRGTPLDLFGRSAERRMERDLIAGYEKDVAFVLEKLSPQNIDTAVELLSLPDRIRGYGPVKDKSVADAKIRYAELAKDLVNPPPAPRQIAAE